MRRRLSLCKPMIPVSMMAERPMLIPSTLTSVKSQTLFVNQQHALSNPVMTKTADEINFVMNTQPNLKGVISEVVSVEEQLPMEEEEGEELGEGQEVKLSDFNQEDEAFFTEFLTSNKVLKSELISIYREEYQGYTKEQREQMSLPPVTSLRGKETTKQDILDFLQQAGITTEMVYETFLNNKRLIPTNVAEKLSEYFV